MPEKEIMLKTSPKSRYGSSGALVSVIEECLQHVHVTVSEDNMSEGHKALRRFGIGRVKESEEESEVVDCCSGTQDALRATSQLEDLKSGHGAMGSEGNKLLSSLSCSRAMQPTHHEIINK
ncbi:hypothetical protein Tco_1245770 [Tanacetum coccineum]